MPEPACPVCGKPADAKLRPFCCRRCADVDLGRWITSQYVVPGPDGEPGDGETTVLDKPEALG